MISKVGNSGVFLAQNKIPYCLALLKDIQETFVLDIQ